MGKPRTPSIFTSPQDASIAFYQAIEARDIEAMMATWAEDEDIVCIHPGGPRLVGYESVRHSWELIFAADTRLTFRLDQVVAIDTVGLAMHSVVELITATGGTAIATNVFMRTPSGWRIVCHHASPAAEVAMTEMTGPLH